MKLFKFMTTLGIGAVAGMLLAPKKGSELRNELKEKGKETLNTAKNMSKDDYIELINKTIDDIKQAIDEFDIDDFKDQTKDKYEELKPKFDELKDKLDDVLSGLKESDQYNNVKEKVESIIEEVLEKIKDVKQKIDEESFEEISVNDVLVDEVFKSVDAGSNYDFQNETYKKGTFSNQYILGLAISRYFLDNPTTKDVSESIIDAYVKKIFGKITYAHESGYFLTSSLCKFTYDKGMHSYKINTECNHTASTNILKKRIKAYKTATVLYVQEKIIVTEKVKSDDETMNLINVYKDINKNDKITTVEEKDIKMDDYLEEAETYEYKFEFDGESFVFKEINKINA